MKHNVMKVPVYVRRRLIELGNNLIVAACTRQFGIDDVKNGALIKYGIAVPAEGVCVGIGGVFEPAANAGRYSRRNCMNTVVVHRNQPKVAKEIETTIQDWHGNPHTVSYMRDCYRRTLLRPLHVKIVSQIIRIAGDCVVVAFKVDEPLDRRSLDFEVRLLSGLNLLLENIGVCNVELAETPISEYKSFISVNWRIFPPGVLSAQELASRMFGKSARRVDERMLLAIQDRHDFLMSLNAKDIVVGIDSFQGYIGARFECDLVVFDCVRVGNAVYILRGEWASLSKKTKSELIATRGVVRIRHVGGWKDEVKRSLAAVPRGESELSGR